MVSNTTYKLKEADFFLGKLDPDNPYFDFYLSAFLNASRSTTWIMRNEFNENPDWRNWFENGTVEKNKKELLKEINNLRIQSTKQNGIQTEYFILEHIMPDADSFAEIERMQSELLDGEVTVTLSEYTGERAAKEEGKYVITGKVKMERNKSLKSREELLDLCVKYYKFLENKVMECTERFNIKK